MYQALYRKWRPRTFDDVVGQEHITNTLKRQVETDRLSHAYLFIGTRGTGKTTCAKILARAVNCEHPVNGNPCNECAACRGIETGTVMDVVELDAASNNRVDDVRALQDEAIFSPASVKKRVYIIDEVHMLSTAAFNALLKILEEPPEHLMFILCTTELHKVLPTIVSRCQRHSFKRIEPDAIAGRLSYVAAREGMDLTADAAALLSRMADGGMRDALSLLDQCSAQEHIDTAAVYSAMGLAGSARIAELLEAVHTGDPSRALTLFDALWKDGKDPAGILSELGDLMRDVMILQVAPKSGDALLSGIYDPAALRRFADTMTAASLMDGMDTIRAADLAGSDPRRAAEMCLVRLCVPETGSSAAALKSRIDRLENMLKNGIPAGQFPVPAPQDSPVVPPAPTPVLQETESQPPVSEDEPPWFTDDDAPPETYEPVPPPFAEPVPTPLPVSKSAPPTSVPASSEPASAAADTELWDALIDRLRGKIDMGALAMLTSSSQCAGVLTGDLMTIYLDTPIALLILNTPDNMRLFGQELSALAGRPVRVEFTEGHPPVTVAPAAVVETPVSKLDELKKFPNVKFE